jgi:hypothetical protein
VPECVPMASVNNKKHFSSAFRISSKDMQMWTHYDIMDNVLCEIVGRYNTLCESLIDLMKEEDCSVGSE